MQRVALPFQFHTVELDGPSYAHIGGKGAGAASPMELKHHIDRAYDRQHGRREAPPVSAPELHRPKSGHQRSCQVFTHVPPMDTPLEANRPAPRFIDGHDHLLHFLTLPEIPDRKSTRLN